MRLSSRSEYGLRAMVYLASKYPSEQPVSVHEVALTEDIPEQYLVQIFNDLKKHQLVQSVRGAQGGFLLLHSPLEIVVGDVVRALEPRLSPMECVSDHPECVKVDHCRTRSVWQRVQVAITQVLDSMTLAEVTADEPPSIAFVQYPN